jgi:hypothetical protein
VREFKDIHLENHSGIFVDLDKVLGPWKFPSAFLQRSWPYYRDPRNEILDVRTSDGYSSHRPFSLGRTGLHFHRFSNKVFSTLPSACFPTEALERRLGFTRIPSHGIDLPPPPVPSQSFEHFLFTQPEWIRRLLPTLVHDVSFDEILFLVVHSTMRLQLAMVQCNLFRERSDGCLPRATPVAFLSHAAVRLMRLLPCRGLWPTFPHYFLTSFGNMLQKPTTTHRHLV